jgi:hypothetical protein
VKRWQEYQHQAAGLLRELGFTADVDVKLIEPNGTVHAIDVVARRTVAGVEVLWIVECKLWNTNVPKEKVLTLQSIVTNLGADRGVLISEKGFQSGALRTAIQKNITLTSLADLRANAAEEIIAGRVAAVEVSLRNVRKKLLSDLRAFPTAMPHTILPTMAADLTDEDRARLAARAEAPTLFDGISELIALTGSGGIGDYVPAEADLASTTPVWRDGVDPATAEAMSLETNEIAEALDLGRLGNWPVVSRSPEIGGKLAWSMPQLLGVVEARMVVLEAALAHEEEQASRQAGLVP